MSYHDNKAFSRNLADEIHDLLRGHCIKCAGGLVCKEDFGIINKGSRNSNSLALTAGKLVWTLVILTAKTYSVKSVFSLLDSLSFTHTCDGEGKLNVAENGLVGNEVIALENEADSVVSVNVPVAVLVVLCASAADNKVTGCVVVKSADEVEEGCLSTARWAKN